LLTLNALGAAKEVFIPLQPHFLSLQGLSQLLETLLLVHNRVNPALKVTGLIYCMFDGRTSLSSEIVNDVQAFFSHAQPTNCPWKDIKIFETRIRRNIKLAESPSHGQTIFEYESNCHGAEDYRLLADEVEAMVAGANPTITQTKLPEPEQTTAPAPETVEITTAQDSQIPPQTQESVDPGNAADCPNSSLNM
jgi:chromosome partitioning protein